MMKIRHTRFSTPSVFSCSLSFLLLIWLICLSSCARFNGTPLEKYLGGEEDIIRLAYSITDDLEKSAFPPLIPQDVEQPVLMTTFVNNNDLSETSTFTRLLQEQMSSRFVQRGYTVKEIKLGRKLHIEPGLGETMLTRNLDALQGNRKAQAISVGTYTISNRNLYINARLVDPVDGTILASSDYRIVMDASILAMFGLPRHSRQTDSVDNSIKAPRESLMTRLLY